LIVTNPVHNEESKRCLHILYSSPNIIKLIISWRMRWAGHVAHMGEERKMYRVFAGKRPLGRSRRRWKEGSRMDLRETGWEGGRVDPK
jgi:hypothetical protein